MARVYPFRAWRFGPSPVRPHEVLTRPGERISAPIEKAFDRPGSFRPVPILLELPEFFDAAPGQSVYYREAHDFYREDHDFPAWLEVGRLRSIAGKRLSGPGARQIRRRRCLPTAIDADLPADRFQRGEAEIGLRAHPVLLKQPQQATCAEDVRRPGSSDVLPKPLRGLATYALD
jgi:hypothetical protein